MHHELLTQRTLFVLTKKGHAESAFRDAPLDTYTEQTGRTPFLSVHAAIVVPNSHDSM